MALAPHTWMPERPPHARFIDVVLSATASDRLQDGRFRVIQVQLEVEGRAATLDVARSFAIALHESLLAGKPTSKAAGKGPTAARENVDAIWMAYVVHGDAYARITAG